MFHAADLPADPARWDPIFLSRWGRRTPTAVSSMAWAAALSSLSKVCVVGPPSRADADVDYTFAQVSIPRRASTMGGNCGNMWSAVGPFAIDEGLVAAAEAGDGAHPQHQHAEDHQSALRCDDGRAVADGDLAIPGVPGTGAPIRLEFIDPGGAITG